MDSPESSGTQQRNRCQDVVSLMPESAHPFSAALEQAPTDLLERLRLFDGARYYIVEQIKHARVERSMPTLAEWQVAARQGPLSLSPEKLRSDVRALGDSEKLMQEKIHEFLSQSGFFTGLKFLTACSHSLDASPPTHASAAELFLHKLLDEQHAAVQAQERVRLLPNRELELLKNVNTLFVQALNSNPANKSLLVRDAENHLFTEINILQLLLQEKQLALLDATQVDLVETSIRVLNTWGSHDQRCLLQKIRRGLQNADGPLRTDTQGQRILRALELQNTEACHLS